MSGGTVITRGLAVGYGARPLIGGIDLEIARGEVIALIGPNGAGKSTLLRTIARQLAPVGGTVEICGRDLRSLSGRELALRMATVLTERTKPELYTCREVVSSGRYPHTGALGILSARDRAAVDRAMEATRTSDLAERGFDAISDGQRQRVLLARAICQEPEVVILDEPTSFLDVRHKVELLAMLRAMSREQGVTVIMSLHEIDLAEKCADRVICVDGSELCLCGAPEDVFSGSAVSKLFSIDGECVYDPLLGSVELPRPEGRPRVFVIAGGGSGAHMFRALQRRGVPFAAGILHENDIDYRIASPLAAEIISERPFAPISPESLERARAAMERCGAVLAADFPVGPMNEAALSLADEARERGMMRASIEELA